MPFALSIITAAFVGVLLWAEFNKSIRWKWIAKPAASLGFVMVAITCGAFSTMTGLWILLGLVFCMIGDVLLIPQNARSFLAGMAAFAAGHLTYIAAFITLDPHLKPATYLVAVLMIAGGAVILNKLWPHLAAMRGPVAIYSTIIAAMVIASTLATPIDAPLRYGFVIGAIGFAISDVFVARDQFVTNKFFNKALGLPLYYGAQLILASSV
ncbi:MAG: lysoplasmalogenase [Marinicaulis sp.]|nr:lysoplasmalogenase [Marinicaulis sp.]